jgi:hypothetical protein
MSVITIDTTVTNADGSRTTTSNITSQNGTLLSAREPSSISSSTAAKNANATVRQPPLR